MTKDLNLAKDKSLIGSLAAMQRAAQSARELAVKTNTAVIVSNQNGQMVRITAGELRKQGYR
ncbi:MAG: hypothetical protein RIR00_1203 [Pseudomonadota bacterium]|jgi:rhodanese-related sulfurtransferase